MLSSDMFIKLFLCRYISQAFKHEIDELPRGTVAGHISLLPGLLVESKASTTTRASYQGFLRWKKWALSSGILEKDCLPAKALRMALYLVCLVQQNTSPSSIVQTFYSMKWAHSIIGGDSPTDSVLVKNILEGAKRFWDHTLYSQRIICSCLIAYAGFLRASELLNPQEPPVTRK